jgi:hypothetical protein
MKNTTDHKNNETYYLVSLSLLCHAVWNLLVADLNLLRFRPKHEVKHNLY